MGRAPRSARASGGARAGALAGWGLLLCLVSCGSEGDRQRAAEVLAELRAQAKHAPIVIINVDTLRADHLGYDGYRRATSPHIDALSRESVRFDWAFAQAPNTPPSQASILTGLYPTRHGRIGTDEALPESVVTLAESLSAAGYGTAAFVDGGYMARGFGIEQGFDLYDDAAGGVAGIGPRVARWLDEHAGAGRPFLLLVHSYDVHTPYDSSPEPYRSAWLHDIELPPQRFRARMGDALLRVWEGRHDPNPPTMTPAEIGYVEALYDGGILYVDHWVGDFLEELRRRQLYDEAVIVFLSDHGEEFLDHKGVMHDKLYAPVARIPLLLKLPHAREGSVVDAAVESIDLVPTLLDAVGVPAIPEIDGESLLPLIVGMESGAEQVALGESPFYGRQIALATGSHRLLLGLEDGRTELFEYRRDPREQKDLAPRNPQLAAELANTAKLWSVVVKRKAPKEKNSARLDPETIERLTELGYLDPPASLSR